MPPEAECDNVAVSLSASSSWSASTVTVCAVFQVEVVNVRLSVSKVRSVPEWPAMATVTVLLGLVASFTV